MSNAHGNILLVEDHASNSHFLAAALRDEDYDVYAVSSGEQALVLTSRTIPDLILLDVNLPGMNGYQVCEHLCADELLRDVPIVFFSVASTMIARSCTRLKLVVLITSQSQFVSRKYWRALSAR